eukprot:6073228-Pyramimonas_sp.AAC.1
MTVLRAARVGGAWGALRMAMRNGDLRAIRHAVTGGVSRAGRRVPAQAARGALAHQIREGRQAGRGQRSPRPGDEGADEPEGQPRFRRASEQNDGVARQQAPGDSMTQRRSQG